MQRLTTLNIPIAYILQIVIAPRDRSQPIGPHLIKPRVSYARENSLIERPAIETSY